MGLNEEIIEKLKEIVGEDDIRVDEPSIYVYSRDATIFQSYPDVIVRPESTEEVSKIVKIAYENDIPITPRGSGTSLCGGAVPTHGGIVIDMRKMNRILSFNIANQTVEVEAGVVCDDLNEFLAPYGYFFPPDPSSSSAATIGGMIGANAAGIQAVKYGKTMDYVLKIEAVVANGEVIEVGANTLKSSSQYDFVHLFCGSEGTLGIITKATLKVIPKSRYYRAAIFFFDDIEKAGKAIVNIKSSGVIPNCMELMDAPTLRDGARYTGLDLPEVERAEAAILIQVDGNVEEQVQRELEICFEAAKKADPFAWRIAETEEEREKIWMARKATYPVHLLQSPLNVIAEDLSVPVDKIPEALKKIMEIPKRLNGKIKISFVGHVGDGNIHPDFLIDETDPEQFEAFLKALEILYKEIVIPLGGTISSEHGVGILRRKFIAIESGEEVMGLMRELKKTFDPKNLFNPGNGKPWGDTADLSRIDETRKIWLEKITETKKRNGRGFKHLDELWRETLLCNRCSMCEIKCPSFDEWKWQTISPRGRVQLARALEEGLLEISEELRDIVFTCNTCDYCITKCPGKVPVVDIIRALKAELSSRGLGPSAHRRIVENVKNFGNPYGEPREKRGEWMEGL
ncbi:MAG: FAD-binding oxidoreductase [Archaeoglobi archaeon]|nr:FAD-binding oxidoreductase [Candidatus Mnemosynella bozhongmuii]